MKKIKDRISNFYNKLIKTKEKIWSHCLALTGWALFIDYIIFIINQQKDFYLFEIDIFFICYFITITLLIFMFFEGIFLKKFKIKCNFFIKNRYYNIFWLIGIIIEIFIIIPIFFILIYQTVFI